MDSLNWTTLLFLILNIFTPSYTQSLTDPSSDIATLNGGAAFAEPDLVSDSSNSWSINLDVNMETISTFGWLTMIRRTYNGKIVGPTWKVKQGDTLQVTLNNQLADIQDTNRPLNSQRFPNTTNLHTHGLHISSVDPQDNVLRHIDPDTSYTYTYQIHADNPPGTYWYHSHVHGSTIFQVHSGLAGMLIVEDVVSAMPAELAAVSCPNNCDKERQLVFQPILRYNGNRGFGNLQDDIGDYEGFQHDSYTITATGQSLSTWLEANIDFYTVNGQLQPIMPMTTGQMYRFRMVNTGGGDTLEIHIVNAADQAQCTIREIATDGVYLDEPRAMKNGQTLLVPAGRVDWMVKCDTAGTYYLKSFPDAAHRLSIGGIPRHTGTLVQLEVTGSAVDPVMNFPSTLPTKPNFLRDLSTVAQADIGGRFVIELNPSTHLNRELWSAGNYYRYKMTIGTVQEWYLTNSDTGASHPVHIHVNHFQVMSYNPYTGPYASGRGANWKLYNQDDTLCDYQYDGYTATNGPPNNVNLEFLGHDTRYAADGGDTLGYATVGDRRDIILVPPLANITIRFEAHEHVGDVIIHCHILAHEDSGMMMVTEVVAVGEDTTANTASAGNYPGTCKSCDRYPFNSATTLCEATTSTLSSDDSSDASQVAINLFPHVFFFALTMLLGSIW